MRLSISGTVSLEDLRAWCQECLAGDWWIFEEYSDGLGSSWLLLTSLSEDHALARITWR